MSLMLLPFLLLNPAHAADVTVTKAQFKTEFVSLLAEKFCEEKRYFRVCFNAKLEDCKKNVTTAATACLAEVEKQLPEKFAQPTEGQKWGEKLGACTGDKYELSLAKNRVISKDCQDASKWK